MIGEPHDEHRPADRARNGRRVSGVQLLAYADRLAGDITGLTALMQGPLKAFSGVHVLPFYVPFDGVDTGFDPIDHGSVDPRLGSWEDVQALGRGRRITADLIVNHVSASSAEFLDWLDRQAASPYDGMFLTFDTVFPDGATENEITAFHRPRPGVPFTAYRANDGTRRLVWTTFMPTQIDLDVRHPTALAHLRRLLATLATNGVTTVRLDAVGYAIKTPGTDSFMTPATLEFVRHITDMAREEELEVLVEVHAHYSQQLTIAPLVDLVYDFALPPLLLHSLGTGTVDRLAAWFDIRPRNAVTVLDTHDGIGVIDAGPVGDRPGLISEDEMVAIFARAEVATGGNSARASVVPAWAALPHQINATFLSVLGGDLTAYLVARAVQLFLPGRPQIYYVGLLGGLDDVELFARTLVGRDVNRHVYTAAEVERALGGEVALAQLALIRLRSEHPAFGGTFDYRVLADDAIELAWTIAGGVARLRVSMTPGTRSFHIELSQGSGPTQVLASSAELIAWAAEAQ